MGVHAHPRRTGRRDPIRVLGAILAFALLVLPVCVSAKGIYATVQAPWTETSLLQEGCEWAARVLDSAGFYECLAIANAHSNGAGARTSSPAQQYDFLMRHVVGVWSGDAGGAHPGPQNGPGSFRISTGQRALYEVEMASRVYSPAVEVHYALAEQALTSPSHCESFSDGTEAFIVVEGGRDDLSNDHPAVVAALQASLQQDGVREGKVIAAPAGMGVVPDLDHVHPLSANNPSEGAAAGGTIILYGLIGEAETKRMYEAVVAFMKANREKHCTFVFRHLPVNPARLCRSASVPDSDAWVTRPLYVQGYGATVDLKSMEYKTVDEKRASAGGNTNPSRSAPTGEEEEDGEGGRPEVVAAAEHSEVGGFDVARLKQRYPALAMQLDSFLSAMEDALGTEDTKVDLDAVEAQNIALAAAYYVQDARPGERLAVLSDLVARFPAYAARLGKLAGKTSKLAALQSIVDKDLLRRAPASGALFVDGVQVMEKDVSLFGVLERLRYEESFTDQLHSILTARAPASVTPAVAVGDEEETTGDRLVPLTGDGAVAALETAVALTLKLLRGYESQRLSMAPRVALPLHAFQWLNDIETMPAFEGLPKAMSTAFQVTSSGQRLMPRRNLVHLCLVLDGTSPWTFPMLAQLSHVVSQGAFVRLGVAFVDPDWQETVGDAVEWQPITTDGKDDGVSGPSALSMLARTLAAVMAVAAETGNAIAIPSLTRGLGMMSQQLQQPLTAEHVYQAAVAMQIVDPEEYSLSELLSDGDFQEFYHKQQSALRDVGLGGDRASSLRLPLSFVNGVKVPEATDIRGTFDAIQAETEYIRALITKRALTDKTANYYETILAEAGSSDHYQPALEPSALETFAYDSVPLSDFLFLQPFLYPVDKAAWGATTKNGKGKDRKAPLVLASTPITSVLLLPSHGSLRDVTHLLSSCLDAHQTPPLPVLSARQQEKEYKKQRQKSKGDALSGFTEIENGGAARLTVLFPESSTPHTSGSGSRRSVQQSIEHLVQHDARVMRETGRLSSSLRHYAAWMTAALAAAAAGEHHHQQLGGMQVDDPSSEEALAKALAMPVELQAVLDSATATQAQTAEEPDGVSARTTRLYQAAVAEFRAAVKKRLPRAHALAKSSHSAVFTVPVLLVNGRAVLVKEPTTFNAEDARFVLKAGAGSASIALQQLLKLNLAGLSASGAGFQPDDLDAAFFATKAVALESTLAARLQKHWLTPAGRALGVPEPLHEEEVLPAPELLGGLAFTMQPHKDMGNGTKATARARHHITLVVDPAARQSQLLVALGEFFLKSGLNISLTVYMNPSETVSRPIRDLFTLVANPTLQFDSRTGSVVPPAAVFRALPTEAVLTLGIEEPNSWTVFSHEAEYDLDNIMLSQLPKHRQFVSATFRIHSLLVAGSVLKFLPDEAGTHLANGLPLTLRPLLASSQAGGGGRPAAQEEQRQQVHSTDTLVMQTMGYYQLQASAGLFHLSVQPGPFAAAYFIAGFNDNIHQFAADYAANDNGELSTPFNVSAGQRLPLAITTFSGLSLDLYVRPVPSSEGQPDILAIAEREARLRKYTWPPQALPNGSRDRSTKPPRATLNIFSVASGHLYERFLRMMMYSVFTASSDKYGKNTTRIKFWVIENFLSPQFKAYIPLLAEHFGFEVGFVTYRWPWWLQRQTEKQRKIWAYKILFLDVIFPLDVDRIIFVDADQTDRADLHELYNMDIADSPVAMTPFCEKHKNKATTGFRFWTQGFWTRHLAGKPYHISAIFLVDLHRFRAMSAGDIYRSTYAQLVKDPHSLSNLDQDLPNYVQHHVPIFSLPEEWLWCETWCDNESKASAKTIDLCNNPLTKMPKLDNAKMMVPNWEETDDMLEDLTTTLAAAQEGRDTL